jgi:hypothetical protein
LQQQKSVLHCRQLTANFVAAMPEITAQILGVTFDSSFKTPVLFKDARCEEVAQKALEAFASYGLKPTQIGLRHRDPAFNYELSFSLFKGNANFTLSAEKLHMDFQNAVNPRDLEIIEDCVAKTYEHIPLPEIGSTFISANLHATATSADEAQKFLSARAEPERGIVSVGTLANILCKSWPQEIRLQVERSLAYPAGLFLTWATHHPGGAISREALKELGKAIEESVTKFDLAFSKRIQ